MNGNRNLGELRGDFVAKLRFEAFRARFGREPALEAKEDWATFLSLVDSRVAYESFETHILSELTGLREEASPGSRGTTSSPCTCNASRWIREQWASLETALEASLQHRKDETNAQLEAEMRRMRRMDRE